MMYISFPTMSSILNQVLSVFIILSNISFASSFGIIESSVVFPSLSTGFLESLPTHTEYILHTTNYCDLSEIFLTHLSWLHNAPSSVTCEFSGEINDENFNLVASAFASEKSQSGNGIRELLSEYNLLLKERPYATKIATGVILAIVGDFVAQLREGGPYDLKRATAFAVFDGCYRIVQQLTYPPLISEFQGQHILGLMGSLGYTSFPVTSTAFGPLEQTLVSQLLIIPTVYYPVFFTITGFVQGLSFQETVERAKKTFVPLMKRNLLFWIPVQFVAFAYVPQDQQISVLIVCGLLWTVILSVSAGAIRGRGGESESDIMPIGEVRMSEVNNAMDSTPAMEKHESETVTG